MSFIIYVFFFPNKGNVEKGNKKNDSENERKVDQSIDALNETVGQLESLMEDVDLSGIEPILEPIMKVEDNNNQRTMMVRVECNVPSDASVIQDGWTYVLPKGEEGDRKSTRLNSSHSS